MTKYIVNLTNNLINLFALDVLYTNAPSGSFIKLTTMVLENHINHSNMRPETLGRILFDLGDGLMELLDPMRFMSPRNTLGHLTATGLAYIIARRLDPTNDKGTPHFEKRRGKK